MPSVTDPQRRPVYIDRVNSRFLAEPIGAGPWPLVPLTLGMFAPASANVVIGRYGTSGPLQELSADVQVDLLNTATTKTLAAARVVAGSTTGPGVLQLTDAVNSTSVTTAATPNAVKTACDLANTANSTANAALPKAGGTMSGLITFAAGQTISGYAALAAAQTFTAAQRGTISALVDGATITPDFAVANNFSVTLGGNRTLANPTNLTAGQSGAIVITQDGTGGRTLAYGSNWKFPGGTAPALTTTASAVDVIAYYVESASRITARLIADVK